MALVAVITGAAQGIGAAISRRFASLGYAVVLVDQNEPLETSVECLEFTKEILPVICDVSNEDDVGALARYANKQFGRIDALVNNAGISLLMPAEQTSIEHWQRVLDVNLTAPFLLSREFGRIMLAQEEGSIVNVSSIAGLSGVADRAAYNASKHGLIGLTRTLAAEWGGRGVRVNAVCPGWVKSEMDVADQALGGYSDEDIETRVPMGRYASPEDIASAVMFLADHALSGFINGIAMPVDGGWTADAGWTSLRMRARERR